MVTAKVGSTVLAESSKTEVVEGNHYFPRDAVKQDLLVDAESGLHTTCPWKGTASYLDARLPDGTVVKDAAWFYPQTKEKAKNIENYVAFYKNKVNVS